MTVLTVSVLSALSFGMVTVGALPNVPLTCTAELAAEPVADALALELELELGFDEPQPAMTRQASSETTAIVDKASHERPQ